MVKYGLFEPIFGYLGGKRVKNMFILWWLLIVAAIGAVAYLLSPQGKDTFGAKAWLVPGAVLVLVLFLLPIGGMMGWGPMGMHGVWAVPMMGGILGTNLWMLIFAVGLPVAIIAFIIWSARKFGQ